MALEIQRRDSISVDEFVRDFLEPNLPVVLGPKLTEHWAARKEWVAGATGEKPNFARLKELYGQSAVQVAQCDQVYFSDQKRVEMQFGDFIDQWRDHGSDNKLYCKDWHFARANPEYQAYTPLAHVSDDWIDLYHGHQDDDYRFCYMGGDGTWTPFHEDVFRSYSWSANICGEKRWTLVPPGQSELFTDARGNWIYNLDDYDRAQFPRAHELQKVQFVQRRGETVFVPSGWWHQVTNIGDTISINHNWANEFNLRFLYARLRSDMGAVRHALRDVADMAGFEDHAQLVLRADSGTDFRSFFAFVQFMTAVYLRQITGRPDAAELQAFDPHFRSAASIRCALQRIADVLDAMAADQTAQALGGLGDSIVQLRQRIAAAGA
ncbi:hypothetical protein GGF46_001835 [Coemansia sp. RSA 552]|nr:hypothetical protein GGF46_001835 [Coemansia sp. RSA 552]